MTAPHALLMARFARAVATYEAQATVQRAAAVRLAEALGRHFHVLGPRILEVGCGTGTLTRLLLARFAPAELVANDLCADVGVCFANAPRVRFLPGDAQTIAWPGPFDAIVSASAVQWFGDLGRFVGRCAEALPQGGVVAVSSFGAGTLREVAALTGRGLRYLSHADFVAAFAEAFEPLETARETCVLRFADGTAVLRHLRETGVTATASGDAPWTRTRLGAFNADYAARFPHPEGSVTLTYEPFWFVGRRR